MHRPLLVSLLALVVACSSDPSSQPDVGDTLADVPLDAHLDMASDDLDPLPDLSPVDLTDVDVQETLDTSEPADTAAPTGPGPFAEGCPEPGLALARQIGDVDRFDGPAAIGETGDFLLANDTAAFIIEDAGKANAYYYYGGILVDAVAVQNCTQAHPEQFEELGLMMGVLQLDIFSSTLRAFRADVVEVISDGSDGGPAIVRATGSDDIFWTTELDMLIESFKEHGSGQMSQPLGVEVSVDYILYPDSPVLHIETTYRNMGPETLHLLTGAEAQFGQTFQPTYLAWDTFSMGGFELKRGIPWMVASDGHGATAYSVASGQLSTIGIAGVTALFDAAQLEQNVSLEPAGEPGDERTTTVFVSVGPTDANSATVPLADVNPEPIPGRTYLLEPVDGIVSDAGTGAPVPGVTVSLAGEDSKGKWQPLDSFVTDDEGRFAGQIPRFDPDMALSLSVSHEGYPQGDLVSLPLGHDATGLTLSIGPTGELSYRVLDEEGTPIPAKIELRQNGSLKRRLWASTAGWASLAMVPGQYDVTVSRGYEYDLLVAQLDVTTNTATEFEATIERVVDTSGYLSLDTHLHAAPSSDSNVPVPVRLVTVAGEGVDVAVATDHETISDWSWAIEPTGLEGFVNTIIGQEVTCTLPEHMNMFPVEQDFTLDARGGIPRWYGLDIDQVYQMLWDRGAQVVCLNHPRGGGGYMTLIEYDSVSGEPALTDPTLLAYPESAALWSWNFNAIELMNGPKMIFRDGASPHKTGHFDDWLGFHNLGYRVTALGSSDTHGITTVGRCRTYVPSSTDDPSQMDADELAANIDGGRAIVSAGAFMRVTVDNEGTPGDTVLAADDVVDVAIHVEASPAVDVAYVKVYANCDQVATLATSAPDEVIKLDTKFPLKLTADAHIVVAAFGAKAIPAALGNYTPTGVPRAISNPVFVDIDGNGIFDPPGPKSCTYDLEGPTE